MSALRLAGALWILAGITCSGLLVFVFVGENLADPGVLLQNVGLPALVLAGGIVALVVGGLLVARPAASVARVSSLIGVAWLVAFGAVVLAALGDSDRGPLLSSSLITGFGVAGALVSHAWHRSRRPAADSS